MLKIKPGYGYWDTTQYPIGGAFRRAGDSGVNIANISKLDRPYKNATHKAVTDDGRNVAFNIDYTEEQTK